MRIYFLLGYTLATMFTSTSQVTGTTPGGMPYTVFSGKSAQYVKAGDFVKINLTQQLNDSIIFSTFGTLPIFQQVPGETVPYDISEIWTKLKLDDSVVAIQLVDTFMKRNPDQVPPYLKSGDKIITRIKMLGIFENDSVAKADYDILNEDWLVQEIKAIEKFLADNSIPAQKTVSGVFVQIIKPGTGDQIDSGKNVTVNYTGTSFSGKKFDSNTDTAFGHVNPLTFVAGSPNMIKGFNEGIMLLKKGAVAKLYVPSILAYGANPNSPAIKPYEQLIFDIEVLDVKEN